MFEALQQVLSHFGEVVHKDASQGAVVLKEWWDRLVGEADESVQPAIDAATVVPMKRDDQVYVQLAAGDLHKLSQMTPPPAAESAGFAPEVQPDGSDCQEPSSSEPAPEVPDANP